MVCEGLAAALVAHDTRAPALSGQARIEAAEEVVMSGSVAEDALEEAPEAAEGTV